MRNDGVAAHQVTAGPRRAHLGERRVVCGGFAELLRDYVEALVPLGTESDRMENEITALIAALLTA